MNIITLDFETFFSDDYTLSKMTTESYIRDPRFEAHGVSIAAQGEKAYWVPREHIAGHLQQFDWPKLGCLCHHSNFDGLILSHHYGVKPRVWFDTLGMARLLLGNHLSVGLDSLARHFGLAAKTVPYNLFRGKHWNELDPSIQRQVADGACHDVALTWRLFEILGKDFPREEYQTLSTTVEMFTNPCLLGDIDLLAKVWTDEATKKDARMAALNVAATDLQSSDKFAELLRAEGVEPEMKEGKNKPIYCFAKTDEFMRGLQEHDNERVRTLAEARLGAKSTLMQTRAETLGWMASRGPMPVYLRYCGAHTTRWSGGDGANWQNFKRGSDIRRAIMAPPGFLLAPIDLSQIECRILNYLAGQDDVIEKFRKGEDPYIGTASECYGFPVTKANVAERGTGKQLELSCGFQAGASTIQNTARLGIYGPPVVIDLATATRWRDIYRSTHPAVVEYWKTAGRMISRIAGGDPLQWGPMLIKDGKIFGPGGTMLHYETLNWYVPAADEEVKDFERDGYWRYKTRHGWTKLYSGKLVENVVQWLARIVLSQACLRILDRLGLRPVLLAHDEGVWVVKDDENKEKVLEILSEEMRRTPTWLPGIPLGCAGGLFKTYEKPD